MLATTVIKESRTSECISGAHLSDRLDCIHTILTTFYHMHDILFSYLVRFSLYYILKDFHVDKNFYSLRPNPEGIEDALCNNVECSGLVRTVGLCTQMRLRRHNQVAKRSLPS